MSNYPNYQVPPPIAQQTSTLAIVSLVAGVLGWTFVPTLGAIVAVITGYMAKSEIRQSNGTLAGDGLATAGLVLGWLHLALAIIGICLVILMIMGFVSVPLCLVPFQNIIQFR